MGGKKGYVHIYEGGFYRIRVSAYGYQTQQPVMLSLQSANRGRVNKSMLGFYDVPPDKPKEMEITVRLDEGDFIVPVPVGLEKPADGKNEIYTVGPKNYTGPGVVVQWIEVGQPDDKRLMKAAGRARAVSVYAFQSSTPIWWDGLVNKVSRASNLTVWHIPTEQSQALAALAQRSMQLQITVQDGTVWVSDGQGSVEITPQRLTPDRT